MLCVYPLLLYFSMSRTKIKKERIMININNLLLFSGSYSTLLMSHKDKRVNLMSQILHGIRVIKMHVWEDHFASKVKGNFYIFPLIIFCHISPKFHKETCLSKKVENVPKSRETFLLTVNHSILCSTHHFSCRVVVEYGYQLIFPEQRQIDMLFG